MCLAPSAADRELVRRVEDGLGRRLFDRTSRRFAITPDGVFAVEAIEQLLRGMSVLEQGAAPAGVLRGPVRLGLIPTLGPYYVRTPRQELILLEHGHCLRTHTLEVCGRSGVGTVPVHATGLETLRVMVSAGIGCAIFPALAVNGDRTWRNLIAYRRFKNPAPTRTIGLISRADTDGIRMARTLTAFLQKLNPPTTVRS